MCCLSFASLKRTLTPVNKDIIVIDIYPSCINIYTVLECISEMVGLPMLVYDRCTKVPFSENVCFEQSFHLFCAN